METSDGYILGLHRITGPRGSPLASKNRNKILSYNLIVMVLMAIVYN